MLYSNVLRRKYRKTPLTEVLFELHFNDSISYEEIVEKFYSQIKDYYPNKENTKRISLQKEKDSPTNKAKLTQLEGTAFYNEDGSGLVRITKNTLSFNALRRSYNGYEDFLSKLTEIINILKELSGINSFNTMRMRYINEVSIPVSSEIYLDKYFNYFPTVITQNSYNFNLQVNPSAFHDAHKVLIKVASLPDENDEDINAKFIIDITNILSIPNGESLNSISESIRQSHENIGRIFEDAITDETRLLFEEDKNAVRDW
jgi:uncharacterized protein (TIGR04255 family)